MSVATTRCGICGRETDPEYGELIGGIWSPATCPTCARRRLLADGGVSIQVTRLPEDAQFELGEIQIRPGAIHVLGETGEHYWPYIKRHACGDRGDFQAAQPARTANAFLNGRGNIVSEYRTSNDHRIWVITSPGKVTLVLAPGEF